MRVIEKNISRTMFWKYVKQFREAGFQVDIMRSWKVRPPGMPPSPYRYASVTGNGIRGGFSNMPSDEACTMTSNGRFAADNSKCFDKFSKCPLCVKLPYDFQLLLSHLRFLASKAGYKLSNSYDFLEGNPFPYQPWRPRK